MNEYKARNKELHLHIEELQMRVGGRGGYGVCIRNVGKVWSVYQECREGVECVSGQRVMAWVNSLHA